MEYLHWQEKVVEDASPHHIAKLYDSGFVFTRIAKGVMHQTRSIRIDLSKFRLNSENRRILKKVEDVKLTTHKIPYESYHWSIGKMAKDFYENKFGVGIFSAQKTKELLTSPTSNFTTLLDYSNLGYAICYATDEILHYSYPFYDLHRTPKDMGLWMMTQAIMWAHTNSLHYVYLGSLQRPGDTYKLQFEGLEWFDGTSWNTDIQKAKHTIT